MSRGAKQVSEVDVERARLIRKLAGQLGHPTPASVARIADLAVPHPTAADAAPRVADPSPRRTSPRRGASTEPTIGFGR